MDFKGTSRFVAFWMYCVSVAYFVMWPALQSRQTSVQIQLLLWARRCWEKKVRQFHVLTSLTSISTFLFAGCNTEELHDLNINPQAVASINMNFLFTAAELGAASGGPSGQSTNINYCAYWMQHLAALSTGKRDELGAGDKYMIAVDSDDTPWSSNYGDPLVKLAEILKQTGTGGFEEGRRLNMRQASRILRALLFHRLTDYYGNIPYSNALNPSRMENWFPRYDHQSTIYSDLLKELDEAAISLNTSHPDDGFGEADIIYHGDVNKWKKFSYSLMLRLAMRISNVDPDKAAEYVNKAVSGGVFGSNDDNVCIPMSETPILWLNGNGISIAFNSWGAIPILGKTLVDKLKRTPEISTDDDPRLMFISGGVAGDIDPLVQNGMPNGHNASTIYEYLDDVSRSPEQQFSTINQLLLDPDEPYLIMQYAEVEFLLAEAVERGIGNVAGPSKKYFEDGVAGAIDMFSMYDPSFVPMPESVERYLLELNYSEGAPNALELIGDQLWISKWFNWWDAWSDWRRSGFPVLVPVNYPGNSTGGTIPRKLFLPLEERAINSKNISAGATAPDDPHENMARVWWDGGN